jgi:hypothetical protein
MIIVKIEGLPASAGFVGKTVILSWSPLEIPVEELLTRKRSTGAY